MNKALMQSTQVTVTFSVHISSDNEAIWLTLALILFTPIMFLWQVMQTPATFVRLSCRLWAPSRFGRVLPAGKALSGGSLWQDVQFDRFSGEPAVWQSRQARPTPPSAGPRRLAPWQSAQAVSSLPAVLWLLEAAPLQAGKGCALFWV